MKKTGCTICMCALLLGLTGCGSADTHVSAAMELAQGLEYRAALTELETAAEAGENERLIARGQGIAYLGLTEYESAIEALQTALAASDGFVQSVDYDLNYYLAAAYDKNGQPAEAEAVYDAILALRPKEEEALFLRGSVRLEEGNYDGAKEDFDTVYAMNSTDYDRLIEIYQALNAYGYKSAGQAYLQNAIDTSGNKMSSYDSGRIYYYLENYTQACVTLEKAREDDGTAESYLYLGMAYEATGDYNYASSVYNQWIAQDQTSAEIYNQLGLCEIAKGDYSAALSAFQSGMQIEGNDLMQTLSYNEIVAYEYLGDFQKAGVLLASYLESYPDDEEAQREQEFLSTR